MAPSATSDLPLPSALEETLSESSTSLGKSPHAPYLHHLASTIAHNLQYQHSWTEVSVHTHSPITKETLPRPMLSGLPPKRAYIHPDEQICTLKAEHETGEKIEQVPEREWVLPSQIQENWSLRRFGEVFDWGCPPLCEWAGRTRRGGGRYECGVSVEGEESAEEDIACYTA